MKKEETNLTLGSIVQKYWAVHTVDDGKGETYSEKEREDRATSLLKEIKTGISPEILSDSTAQEKLQEAYNYLTPAGRKKPGGISNYCLAVGAYVAHVASFLPGYNEDLFVYPQ